VARQRARYEGLPWQRNAHVPAAAVDGSIPLSATADGAWRELIGTRALTGRGAARVRRVARTLADLDDERVVDAAHLEAAALLRGDVP
jgi:predicted ATPase with chaperone activity